MTAPTRPRRVVRPARVADARDALRLGPLHVGGKAYSLARLQGAGERVPAWMVVTADALESHLEAAGALGRVERELDALGRTPDAPVGPAAAALQAIVDGVAVGEALREEIAAIAERLGGGPFAVRSSAAAEDGERFSFAGQLESELGVEADGLAAAVHRCWRSALSARVLDYRRRAGALAGAVRVAVVVQRLVRGDTSGVLFTVDPVTGNPARMRLSACRGTGDALVSGALEGDEYLLAPDGSVVEARAGEGGPLLGAVALRAIAAAGRRIAAREGAARDIEWTLRGGELWPLQSRPVTAGAPPPANRVVWDNSNIQESYCGVTTPLTFSFARAAYASVYEQTMRALGVSERTIAAHRPVLRTMLGLIRGRVYYNLNAWYRGLLLLPAFRRNKADMERMMGVEEPVDFVADERPGLAARIRRIPALARTLASLLAAFATLDRDAARFRARFDACMRAIDRPTLPRRPLAELMTLLDHLERECIGRWTTPIVNDFHVMMSAGRLRRLVARAIDDEAGRERTLQTLLGGAAAAIAAGPAPPMLALGAIARAEPQVRAALEERDGAAALAAAREASPRFARTLDDLLERFGDRCMGELKMESRSLRDDPGFVVRVLRNYIGGAAPDPARLAAARAAREEAERATLERLGLLGRRRFRRALAAARRGIERREEMRLARTRLFGVHRDLFRAIGARLREMGRLDREEDVLYLTVEELRGFWDGTGASADLAALARARRVEFAAYEGEAPPNRIVTMGAPPAAAGWRASTGAADGGAERPIRGGDARVLRGLGCSAGSAEGIVRIVRAPSDELDLDGHILVAARTDPGWAPLFPSARAIVVERGSLLSHSAVLARELGLPAVVGIPGVLETLRDGERVRVDGAAGTVERLEGPCAS